MALLQIPQIQRLPTTGVTPNVTPLPQLPQITQLPGPSYIPYKPKQQADLVSNYNDPYDLNSMADVIAASFNNKIDNANWFDKGPLQALNIIPNTVKMINDTTIEPLKAGEFGKLAINNLMALSETLDVVANPVKGYIMEGEQGVVNALGFTDAGRKNYDWDTGNLAKDIGLELISDPLNWLTLFTKPIITGVTKASVKSVLKEGGAQAGKNLDDIVASAVRSYVWGDKANLASSLLDVGKAIGRQADDTFVKSFETAMDYLAKNAEHYTNLNIIKGVMSLVKSADKLDDAILKTALKTTPATGGLWIAKKGFNPVFEYFNEVSFKIAKKYETPTGHIDFMKLDDYEREAMLFEMPFSKMVKKIYGFDFIPEELRAKKIKGAMFEEASKFWSFYKTVQSEKYPDILPEYKVNKIHKYLDNNFDGDYETFLKILHDYNEANPDTFQLLEQIIADGLNIDLQKANFDFYVDKNKAQAMYDYISKDLFKNRDIEITTKHALLDAYAYKEHGVRLEDYIKYLEGLNVKHEGKFEYIYKVLKNIEDEYILTKQVTEEIAAKEALYKKNEILVPRVDEIINQFSAVNNMLHPRLKRVVESRRLDNLTKTEVTQTRRALKEELDVITGNLEAMFKSYATNDLPIYNEILNKVTDMLADYSKKLVNAVHIKGFDYKVFSNFNNRFSTLMFNSIDELTKLKSDLQKYTWDNTRQTLESSIKDTSKVFKEQAEFIYSQLKDKMKQAGKVMPSQTDYDALALDLRLVYNSFIKDTMFTKTTYDATVIAEKMRKLLYFRYDEANQMVVELDEFEETFQELYNTVTFYKTRIENMIQARATKDITETYLADVQSLQEIMAVLDKHVEQISPKLTAAINVLDDIKYYQLQIEKMYPTELAVSDKEFNKLLDEILTPNTELYNFFHNLAMEGDEKAIHALEGFYHFKNYKEFRTSLAEAQIDPKIKTSFLSSLQKYARTDAREVNKSLNKYTYRLFQDTEQHYNSVMMKRRLKVDTLFDEYIRGDEELLQQYSNDLLALGLDDTAHNAMVDSIRLKYVSDATLANVFPDTPDIMKFYLDLETTGLNKYIDDITQFAIFSGNPSTSFMQNVSSDIKPLSSTIRAITGVDMTSRVDLLSLYEFTYQRMASDVDKAFMNMLQYLEDQIGTGKQVRVFIHNGDRLDVPFLKEKLTRILAVAHDTGANTVATEELYERGMRVLSKIDIIDTYKEMCKIDNYLVLDDLTKKQLEVMLKSLAEKQSTFHFNKEPNYVPYFIQPLNSSVGARFIELADTLDKQTYSTTRSVKERVVRGKAISGSKKNALDSDANLAKRLRLAGADIQQFFISIKQANKKYAGQYVDATLFENQEFLDEFGALNLSQLLYSAIDPDTSERVFIEGVRHFGYKKAINTEAIREFFDVNRHIVAGINQLSFDEAERYTRYAKYIQNYVDHIENGRLLELNADRINKVAKQVLDHIHAVEDVPIYLQRLKAHDSFAYNYAILRFLHRRPEDLLKHFWDDGIKNVVSPEDMDIIEFVTDPMKWTRHTKYSDRTISFIEDTKTNIRLEPKEKLSSQDIMSLIEDVDIKEKLDDRVLKMEKLLEKYDAKIDDLDDIAKIDSMHKVVDEAVDRMQYDINYLESISNGFDKHSLQRAYQQKKIAELNKIYDTVVNYRDMLHSEPTLLGKEKLYNNMKTYTNNRALLEVHQVTRMSNQDLFNHLATNARRLITFNADDFKNNEMFVTDLADLLSRKGELKELGIDVNVETLTYSGYTLRDEITEEVRTMQQVYITLNKDLPLTYVDNKVYHNGVEIVSPQLKEYAVEDLIQGLELTEKELKFYTAQMEEARRQLINLSDGKVVGGLGEIANQIYYKEMYNYLPDKIKKLLPDITETINKNTVTATSFNHSLLGTPFNRQRVASAMPNDVLSIYANSGKYLSKRTSTINEYLQLYYDDIYSINVGVMKDLTDRELFDMINDADGFTLAFLKDVDGKPMPTEIKLLNLNLVKEARRLNAVIIPTQTYNKSFEVIQDFKWSESRLNFWHKIIYAYKTGYLASFGALIRNVVDSTMKNMISTGDPLGTLRSYGEGMRTYLDFKSIMDDIYKMDGGKSKENIDLYFKSMNRRAMNQDMFSLVYGFMEDGPAAGEIPSLIKYLDKGKDNSLWGKYVHLSSMLLSPNTEFEHIARLSEYLWAIKHGYTNSAAYELVTKTHFDYGLKNKKQLMTELVIPFYTFKMRNLEYWIDAIELDPRLLSLFRDIMTPIWNFDSYDEKELERNRSLQYQILSGNIPLQGLFNNLPKEMTFKINPSFMDVYNTMTDPLGTVQNSLAPPVRAVVNMSTKGFDDTNFFQNQTPSFFSEESFGGEGVGLIPFIGAMYQRYAEQGAKYYDRTGNVLNRVLPDVFGATQRWQEYPQRNTSSGYQRKQYVPKPRKAYIRRPWITYGKKAYHKNTYHGKVYSKNFYHKRNYDAFKNVYNKVYTSSGSSKVRTRMNPVTPTTLKYKLRLMHHYF